MKGDKMCGTCKSIGQITNGYQILVKILMWNDYFGDLVIDEMLILKLNIKEKYVMMWIGCTWVRTVFSSRIL
jgi:hypothetical protein